MAVGYTIFFNEGRDPEVNYRGLKRKGDDWVIMQFTGLSDKAGKEIYEGDILKKDEHWRKEGSVKEVVWKEGGFTYKDTWYDYDGLLNVEEWKVIGNIWEHANLNETK